jgi:protein-S-isoprenylcysteine O-methyltransferase Ste14
MWLVLAFEAFYIADSVFNEDCILTTMDITTDGFGFMLAFGDLAWVPFTYSLQARFLVDFPVQLSPLAAAAILALQVAGFYIFRGANLEKDRFKKDPTHPAVKDLPYIKTATGSRLLAGGWWGKARHINYLGDWLMSVSWCLPTGLASVVPYFYPVYFAVLLLHRDMRDDHKCHAKYGPAWEQYRRAVPWRIVPFVY